MASIKFLLQSKSTSSNIYIRYSVSRAINLKRKTGFVIDFKNWNVKDGMPAARDENQKALKITLQKLKLQIESAYNDAVSNGLALTPKWLQHQIDLFTNKRPVLELDVLTTYIDKYISEAPFKQNQKKELGLSQSRIKNLRLFQNTVAKYQDEVLKGKQIMIKDVNLQFVEKFKMWLFNNGYSVNYVGKNISNLKAICNDAHKNDVETSTQLKSVKVVSESRASDEVIYLSEFEQQKIKDAPIVGEALLNARKWLLLGCLIGQRGGDLLNISDKNIKDLNGIKIIELRQQKTGKLVAIPLLPEALEIVESGLPYKISLVKFNAYIKDICKAANLDQMLTGRKKESSHGASAKGSHPKHELITSHVCRRSFATNFYGRIPTPVLMNITAHGTEKIFLAYIGKTTYDNAYQMLEYFSKLAPRKDAPQMEVLRNAN